jgi:hypothetical protein
MGERPHKTKGVDSVTAPTYLPYPPAGLSFPFSHFGRCVLFYSRTACAGAFSGIEPQNVAPRPDVHRLRPPLARDASAGPSSQRPSRRDTEAQQRVLLIGLLGTWGPELSNPGRPLQPSTSWRVDPSDNRLFPQSPQLGRDPGTSENLPGSFTAALAPKSGHSVSITSLQPDVLQVPLGQRPAVYPVRLLHWVRPAQCGDGTRAPSHSRSCAMTSATLRMSIQRPQSLHFMKCFGWFCGSPPSGSLLIDVLRAMRRERQSRG